jgi:hypothetical protein
MPTQEEPGRRHAVAVVGRVMGKRSSGFARIARDYYRTPLEAVVPLIPHLPADLGYIEPFAGDGALIDHIGILHGSPMCHDASDIEPKAEFIRRASFEDVRCPSGCLVITNPPWTRDILHGAIDHFGRQAPTWLLFDADWVHTEQSIPFLPMLRKIVSIGRVRWFPESRMTGKDNCAWHLFHAGLGSGCEFVGRQL